MNQAKAFMTGVGDDYYERNEADFGKRDPIEMLLEVSKLRPTSVLEIGSANGWRLRKLNRVYGCSVAGVEPSKKAVDIANKCGVRSYQGTAQNLSMFKTGEFDLVIFGFCLWLCDPQDWFHIAGEAERVLVEGGHLIVHDCVPPKSYRYNYAPPQATDREKGMIAWMADHSQLWKAHPGYRFLGETTNFSQFSHLKIVAVEAASLFLKSMKDGFPVVNVLQEQGR